MDTYHKFLRTLAMVDEDKKAEFKDRVIYHLAEEFDRFIPPSWGDWFNMWHTVIDAAYDEIKEN